MEWHKLPDGRQCYNHPMGFSVIKPPGKEPAPLFCDVCKSPMLSREDVHIYEKYQCCESCSIRWVDLNKEKWLTGWRPTIAQIAQELSRRRIRHTSFFV